jgi:hypothetical protein
MQVSKIKEAISLARQFARRAEEVLAQADADQTTRFLLADGRHAKVLKKLSTKVMMALTEMRRP